MDERVGLEELGTEWRLALAEAEDALGRATRGGYGVRLPDEDAAERRRRLAEERARTARLLDAAARQEHVTLAHHLDAPRPTRRELGLTGGVERCVFDLDALLAGGDALQEEAWAAVLDPFLLERAERAGERTGPFRPLGQRDYREHLHGRPRLAGLHSFLGSRGIAISPTGEAVLARAKSDAFERRLDRRRPAALGGSRAYLEALREADVEPRVVSESEHARELLVRTGLADLVRLGDRDVDPAAAAVFATTAELVARARRDGYLRVLGVEGVDDRAALLAAGAERVVADFAELY